MKGGPRVSKGGNCRGYVPFSCTEKSCRILRTKIVRSRALDSRRHFLTLFVERLVVAVAAKKETNTMYVVLFRLFTGILLHILCRRM